MVSPLIVAYAIGLLLVQYIFSLNLNDTELPVETNSGYKYKEIGMIKAKYGMLPLGVQVGAVRSFFCSAILILYLHVDGLVQDCSKSSALVMELLQSCTKPLM